MKVCGYKIDNIKTSFVISNHILALFSFNYIENYSDIITLIFLYQLSALGITAGLHRLWSHRSYKAKLPTRFLLMLLESSCFQTDIFNWVKTHRVHHKFSDTEKDPHNINNGIFFAHIGWVLVKREETILEEQEKIDISDLKNDPIAVLDNYLWPYDDFFMCYILPSIYTLYYENSFMKGFLLYGCLKWILVSHATWCVNSFAHMYGDRPFRKDIQSAENKWVSILTVGEGWHNWHHTYPYDYACSDEGIFLRWNPTKLLIDTLGFFGQTYDHKRKSIKKN